MSVTRVKVENLGTGSVMVRPASPTSSWPSDIWNEALRGERSVYLVVEEAEPAVAEPCYSDSHMTENEWRAVKSIVRGDRPGDRLLARAVLALQDVMRALQEESRVRTSRADEEWRARMGGEHTP